MMNADIEALVLSGELFNPSGRERGASPPRTPSPDHGWHDDLLSTDGARESEAENKPRPDISNESIGMGPGRTGVKGVIRDRDEANAIGWQQAQHRSQEKAAVWERGNLGGNSYLEEERAKARRNELFGLGEKVDQLVLDEKSRDLSFEKSAIGDVFAFGKKRRFGHLREVGVKGFVSAVEKEDRGIYVIVHLYDPSLDRCYILDDTLSKLARSHPDTKFLRARAAALGFASTKGPSSSSSRTQPFVRGASSQSYYKKTSIRTSTIAEDDDDDDPYADSAEPEPAYRDDDDEDGEEEDLDSEEEDVDLDVLPTLLVYRDGQLVHNWVRVDWEAGPAGIEDLLERQHVIEGKAASHDNLGLPSDDDDEVGGIDDSLFWSDDDKA